MVAYIQLDFFFLFIAQMLVTVTESVQRSHVTNISRIEKVHLIKNGLGNHLEWLLFSQRSPQGFELWHISMHFLTIVDLEQVLFSQRLFVAGAD